MIQKYSILKPADNCGVLKSNVFHLYKGSQGRLAYVNNFVKTSSKLVIPENPIKKKSKIIGIIIRTKFKNKRIDGSFISFFRNAVVLLKKRLTPKGALLKGPVSRNIRKKKFLSSFSKTI